MANPEVFKKLGDGKVVDIPVGFGESLSGVHEEVFISIMLAIYESIDSAITHTNAIQSAALNAADFSAFKSAVATGSVPAAVKTISVEKGLRN